MILLNSLPCSTFAEASIYSKAYFRRCPTVFSGRPGRGKVARAEDEVTSGLRLRRRCSIVSASCVAEIAFYAPPSSPRCPRAAMLLAPLWSRPAHIVEFRPVRRERGQQYFSNHTNESCKTNLALHFVTPIAVLVHTPCRRPHFESLDFFIGCVDIVGFVRKHSFTHDRITGRLRIFE